MARRIPDLKLHQTAANHHTPDWLCCCHCCWEEKAIRSHTVLYALGQHMVFTVAPQLCGRRLSGVHSAGAMRSMVAGWAMNL